MVVWWVLVLGVVNVLLLLWLLLRRPDNSQAQVAEQERAGYADGGANRY